MHTLYVKKAARAATAKYLKNALIFMAFKAPNKSVFENICI
jgi:hypothetical protein